MHSAGGADLLDALLAVRTVKLIWPTLLAEGVRERLSSVHGSAFAVETTACIEDLLQDAEVENIRTFAAPVADLAMGAWVRAGRPARGETSPTFSFPIEPKETDARTRRALLTRLLNCAARHNGESL